MILTSLIYILFPQLALSDLSNYSFPDGFLFGVATSAYQIEGAWNEGGKGESIWDYYLHKNPSLVADKSNGDVAADSYHKWMEDVQLIKNLGANFYRFSIAWTRILPLGSKNSAVNSEGITYYSNLIDELLKERIEPVVTIFHWDTPQQLELRGGWLNETIIDDYVYYATLLFKLYGDRVKKWITFNEFNQICEQGYSTGAQAPFKKAEGIGGYQCFHTCVIAHGKIYRIYEKDFKPIQRGQVGVSIDTFFAAPLTDSEDDKEAAEQLMQFNYGWYSHPIVLGNYPPVVIARIDELSRQEGFNESRLPKFTEEQIDMIRGSFDFLGLNHYSTVLATFTHIISYPEPSHSADGGVYILVDPLWKPSAAIWLWDVPWGMRKLLVWIKEHYNNPPVLITENGWAGRGVDLEDIDRVNYMQSYLSEVLKAIHDNNCNVIGYSAWSLLDNFEWLAGYTQKYGITYVDFDSPNRTRIPKKSYKIYQQVIDTKRLVIN